MQSPEVPLPLAPRYGGLGGPRAAHKGSILVGQGEQFIEIPHPEKPGHILQSFNENWVGWSNHTLELLADVRLDQSLHRSSSPSFAGLRLGGKEGGVNLRALASDKELGLSLASDCTIDQDLSKEADVFFKSVRTSSLKTPIIRIPELGHPVDVGEAALGNIRGIGLALFDGKDWHPVAGNLSGKGASGRLAVFSSDKTLVAATGISYTDTGLGLGVADPAGKLHVRGIAIFEDGVTLGTIGPKTKDGTLGFLEGKVGVWADNAFKSFGSGEGNVRGKGKAGQLALWKDEDDLAGSPVFVSSNGSLCAENIIGDYIAASKKLIIHDLVLENKDGQLHVNEKAIALDFKRGALSAEGLEIQGQGALVGGSLKIIPHVATHEKLGVARFSNEFALKDGLVSLDYSRLPLASYENGGLLSKEDYKKFAEKGESLKLGKVSHGEGVKISGDGTCVGGDLRIEVALGNHTKPGLTALSERDFIFREGIAFLREKPVTHSELSEALAQKMPAFQPAQVYAGRGFASDYKLWMVGGPERLDLALASAEQYGIARFSERDFLVQDGFVSARRMGIATDEQPGLMASGYVQALNKLCQEAMSATKNGKISDESIALWRKGELHDSGLTSVPGGIAAKGFLQADALLSSGGVGVGASDLSPSDAGAGFLRYQCGALEVSNGEEWVRLRAGGLAGSGEAGSLALWTGVDSLSASRWLSWDEKRGRLGLGVKDPAATVDACAPGASLRLVDSRPSSAATGATLALGTDDGQDAGQGDCLGSLLFVGRRGTGAAIRAVARGNWDGLSSPGGLVLATTPDGQTTPQDQVFLTNEGYIGILTSKPTAPLHVSSKNRVGISAICEGALRLGNTDQSSSVVGAGVIRYSGGSLQISDGTQWRSLAFAN
jgi:hypothetical protein